jgi:hypothetical protein
VWYTAVGEDMWMLSDDFRALTERFKDLVNSFKEDALPKARSRAWNRIIAKFIKTEIKDEVELINMNFLMLNPLAERKVELFEG